jgi:mono/diheme cytochrome c family protein
VVCHQATRLGLPPVFPSLVGIVAKVGEGKVRDTVTNGVPTSKPPMPAFGEKLSSTDIDNLLAFLKTTPK